MHGKWFGGLQPNALTWKVNDFETVWCMLIILFWYRYKIMVWYFSCRYSCVCMRGKNGTWKSFTVMLILYLFGMNLIGGELPKCSYIFSLFGFASLQASETASTQQPATSARFFPYVFVIHVKNFQSNFFSLMPRRFSSSLFHTKTTKNGIQIELERKRRERKWKKRHTVHEIGNVMKYHVCVCTYMFISHCKHELKLCFCETKISFLVTTMLSKCQETKHIIVEGHTSKKTVYELLDLLHTYIDIHTRCVYLTRTPLLSLCALFILQRQVKSIQFTERIFFWTMLQMIRECDSQSSFHLWYLTMGFVAFYLDFFLNLYFSIH